MHRIFLLILCLFMLGCATTYERVYLPEMSRRFLSLSQVYNGMTREEVESIVGEQVIVGYEMTDPQNGQYKPITVKNPYREETVQKGVKVFTVEYYLAGIKHADDKITDEELMPFVFYKNKLVGMGWEYLNKRIKGN